MQVLPSGAVHRDVDDELFIVATAPMHLDAAALVGKLGVEPDACDRSRNHQPRIGAVQQPGDVNGGVEQRDCRGFGQLNVGVQFAGRRPAGADRPSERTPFTAPGPPQRGNRLVDELGVSGATAACCAV